MAIPRTCTFLHQLLLSSPNPSNIALNRASLQSSINSPLQDIGSRTIVLLVLLSIALQTWGWSSPSFLVSSILCICSSLSMTLLFPADAVFFLGWPTWAKLAVVLGGLLTLILITAFCVKLRNWRRDMRLEKTAAEEQIERAETTLVGRCSDDTPFGIRALTEDQEVEGVWNSRAVTALHRPAIQPSRSSISLRFSGKTRKGSSVSLASLHNPADVGLASPKVSQPPMDSCTRAGLVREAPTSRKPGKKMIINYGGPYFQSEAAKLILDRESGTPRARLNNPALKMQLQPITNRTPTGGGGRKFVLGARPKSTSDPPRRETVPEDPLERMEAHRRFHAAESGQLLPRSRRHTDLDLTTPLALSASDSDDSDTSSARAFSWPHNSGDMNLGQRVRGRAQRMEGPNPVPFRAFVESLPTTKTPPSAWTDKIQAKVDARLPVSSKGSDTSSRVSIHTSQSSFSSTTTAPTSPADSVSIINTRSRKINNGFELLPAGALMKEPSVKEFGLWPENRVAEKKPKKLQKRSPSNDAASRRSSSESRRFSGDHFRLPVF